MTDTAKRTLSLFDTFTRKVKTFPAEDSPARSGAAVSYYTCGPTVYNSAHIGNFRAYLFEDLAVRTLKYLGWSVKQVMNLTDIDDKTIKGANPDGEDLPVAELRQRLNSYTKPFIEAFFADLKLLNITPAAEYPRATEHIGEMVALIGKLIEKGYAYEGDDGHWYYSIRKFTAYGKLSGVKLDETQSGARVDSDEYEKDDARDFSLWKKHRVGEPAWEPKDFVEDSPLPLGRPGWHIECSAMATKHLGTTLDMHSGGHDNIFPHHENEIAQSEAASGERFVRHWLHCGYLIVNGEKMSKSKGNFYTLGELVERDYDPLAIRLLLLSTHYRKPLNFTLDGLKAAEGNLRQFRGFLTRLAREEETASDSNSGEAETVLKQAGEEFSTALAEDLNIARAIGVIFEMMQSLNRFLDAGEMSKNAIALARETMLGFDEVLGLKLEETEDTADLDVARIEELVAQRTEAKRNRDFATSDSIRDELAKLGIVLEDTPQGTVWRKG